MKFKVGDRVVYGTEIGIIDLMYEDSHYVKVRLWPEYAAVAYRDWPLIALRKLKS